MPTRAEPRTLWRFPASKRVPVLAIAGGADPQAPTTNLPDLSRNFRDSRIVNLPHVGHELYLGGCFAQITGDFINRGTTKGLNTSCLHPVAVPAFELTG
jgi:hypothetical protein